MKTNLYLKKNILRLLVAVNHLPTCSLMMPIYFDIIQLLLRGYLFDLSIR